MSKQLVRIPITTESFESFQVGVTSRADHVCDQLEHNQLNAKVTVTWHNKKATILINGQPHFQYHWTPPRHLVKQSYPPLMPWQMALLQRMHGRQAINYRERNGLYLNQPEQLN